jgi:hypothetical protein
VLIEVTYCKIGSFTRKGNGDSSPDAAVAAGDECDFSDELAYTVVIVVLRLWARNHDGLDARLSCLMLWRALLFRHGHHFLYFATVGCCS